MMLPFTQLVCRTFQGFLVGPGEQSMIAHGPQLESSSDFFTAALKKEWTEGRMRTIKLPEESPEIMAQYLNHLYSAKLPTKVFTTQNPGQHKNARYECLAELCVLGERMLDRSLRNAVIREILRLRLLICSNTISFSPATKTVNIIYKSTSAGSPARRLLVGLNVRFARETWHSADADPAFLYYLTQALLAQIGAHKNCNEWRGLQMSAGDYLL